MKRFLLGMLVVLTVGSCSDQKKEQQKAPVRVKSHLVSPGYVDNALTYVGIVEEREGTAVSFTGMGVVKRVLVSEGQAVSRGQLIAEMDDTQARNLLSGAEAQMAQADDALKRYQMLHDNGSLPEVKWVEVQSMVAQAKSQLEVAKKNLSDCRLTAPVSGIIGKKLIQAGETALPSQAVVTILDVSAVKVKVSIPEAEMNGISATTASTVHVEAAGKTVSGGRIEKGVVADALTHTYDIRIRTICTCDSGAAQCRRKPVCMDGGWRQYGASLESRHRCDQRQPRGSNQRHWRRTAHRDGRIPETE